MNRFDISLFGFRLIARGYAGIAGALLVVAVLVGFAVASSLIALLAEGVTLLLTDNSGGAAMLKASSRGRYAIFSEKGREMAVEGVAQIRQVST
jgi:apolipoprotein N-acyltransferase